MYRKLSNGISWALHPFLLPLYMIGVLLTLTVFAHYPSGVKIYLLWVVALYAIIIPLLALGVLRSLGRISDYRIDDRRERLLPLLVGAVCYVLCAITIAKIPSAIFLRKFMIAAACCEVMCLAVSLYWKISLHLTAMGAVVALLVVMNIAGVGDMMVPLMIAILCAGALASARLYLGCHNGQQVLAGFCGGFAVAALAVLTALVVAGAALWLRPVMYVAFDREFARSQGIATQTVSYLMAALTAVTIVLAIRVMGIVLLISLMTVPAVTMNTLSKSFRTIAFGSAVLGALGGVAGLAVSYQWELPSGVAIIFVLTASLIVAKLLSLRHESAKTRRG